MKKAIAIIAAAIILMAFTQEEKKYTVTLSVAEWSAVINSIDSKQISALLEKQLVPQIQAEQAKVDTLKKK